MPLDFHPYSAMGSNPEDTLHLVKLPTVDPQRFLLVFRRFLMVFRLYEHGTASACLQIL